MKKFFIIYVLSLLAINYLTFSDENDNKDNDDNLSYEEAKIKHERENPAFCQKGGMMRVGEHSFYLRTNDEWTGFSTIYFGYRYAVSKAFNIAVEGGISPLPHVYIAAVLLHFKLFETPNKLFFMGMRIRFGYRYQDSDFSQGFWPNVVGQNYLTLRRNGFYLATDFTVALRFGKHRGLCIYYTIYPRIDIDLIDIENMAYFLFCPIMVGFEVRFPRKQFRWSFAVEAGYTFPIPLDAIPQGRWVNFPSLANISINYRFGDKFYSKKNLEKYNQ